MSAIIRGAVDKALAELERRQRTNNYFNDPVAWADYMLGATLWSKQREVVESVLNNKSTAVKAGHGVGKLVAPETPLPTVDGWVRAEDVVEGDLLFDECGNPTRVVAKSPVWDQVNFRITFDDGETIEAGENHEWDVLDLSRRTAAMKRGVEDWREHWGSSKTYTTRELFDLGVKTSAGQNRWRIPLTKPLNLPDADLPIDPYVLGFWLGDGTSHDGGITFGRAKGGLIGEMAARGYSGRVRDIPEKNSSYVTSPRLRQELGAVGLIGNKHIPRQYLRASEAQRRELLAGIMDSDGFIMKSGGGADVGIDMTRERLSNDIYDLVVSLGYKVHMREGEAAYTKEGARTITGTRYRLNWTPEKTPFKIRGEGWRASTSQRSKHTVRTIVSIEEVGRVKNFCIEVDSPRHLYLAGRGLVPTHNSFLVSLLICWWVDTRYPNVFVASTAPSQAQIGAIVWREIRQFKAKIDERYKKGLIDHTLPGYITSLNEWKDDAGTVIGFGRRPPENKEESAVQGIHATYVLALGDESCGLSEEMIDALSNITSNANSRRVLIGNPTNPSSHFGKIFREDTGAWALHTISVLDSPHFTDEKNELPESVLENLTGPEYVEDKKKEYGEDSPRYKARVLGEFAFDLGDTLIKEADIAPALDFVAENTDSARVILGCDVARFGKDSSVVYSNVGGRLRLEDSWAHDSRTTESANRIHRIAVDLHADEVRVDGHGIGGGVLDVLETLAGVKYKIVDMNSNARTRDPKQWHNARAYWWDEMRRMLRNSEIDLDIEDETLRDELMSVEYTFNKRTGGLVIESKEDMRKRGVKSPDFADAAIYACADLEGFLSPEGIDSLNVGDRIYMHYDEEPAWWIGF